MNEYDVAAARSSKIVTNTFSTSFSSASSMLAESVRQDVYNIYGLVRIADEIVDTYQGNDARKLLDALEAEVYAAIKRQFSANVIVHAFAKTAQAYGIKEDLIEPFFHSMRLDTADHVYDQKLYDEYIYGSAEVVGLMCLRVFVQGDDVRYKELEVGARALGAAFQKVNFLRDIKDDYETRARYYFPLTNYKTFDDETKRSIEADIAADFTKAKSYIRALPKNSRQATSVAYAYYQYLLKEITSKRASDLMAGRVRVSDRKKLALLAKAKVGLV